MRKLHGETFPLLLLPQHHLKFCLSVTSWDGPASTSTRPQTLAGGLDNSLSTCTQRSQTFLKHSLPSGPFQPAALLTHVHGPLCSALALAHSSHGQASQIPVQFPHPRSHAKFVAPARLAVRAQQPHHIAKLVGRSGSPMDLRCRPMQCFPALLSNLEGQLRPQTSLQLIRISLAAVFLPARKPFSRPKKLVYEIQKRQRTVQDY